MNEVLDVGRVPVALTRVRPSGPTARGPAEVVRLPVPVDLRVVAMSGLHGDALAEVVALGPEAVVETRRHPSYAMRGWERERVYALLRGVPKLRHFVVDRAEERRLESETGEDDLPRIERMLVAFRTAFPEARRLVVLVASLDDAEAVVEHATRLRTRHGWKPSTVARA